MYSRMYFYDAHNANVYVLVCVCVNLCYAYKQEQILSWTG